MCVYQRDRIYRVKIDGRIRQVGCGDGDGRALERGCQVDGTGSAPAGARIPIRDTPPQRPEATVRPRLRRAQTLKSALVCSSTARLGPYSPPTAALNLGRVPACIPTRAGRARTQSKRKWGAVHANLAPDLKVPHKPSPCSLRA